MDTIFTKIINREIPAEIIYEDNTVLAFLDITPVNHGHALVVPKVPFVNIFDGDAEVLAHMVKVGQKIAQAQQLAGLADGVNFLINNGPAAGQEVFHSHLHIIPRKIGDESYTKPKHVVTTPEQLAATKALIQSKL
jgi:histidine triad (HIT) family protein